MLIFDTVSLPVDLEDKLRDGIMDIAIDCTGCVGLLKPEFVTPHRRGEIERLPQAISELYKLGLNVAVRVSELLEIPTVVASTDLLGIFPASMGSLMEKRLGLRVLAIPLELPSVPIYMIWHETRRNDTAHRWLRELVIDKPVRVVSG